MWKIAIDKGLRFKIRLSGFRNGTAHIFILNSLSILAGVVMLAMGNPGGVLMILSGVIGFVGIFISEQLAGAASMAMLAIQTIAIGVKCLNCCTPYGIIALAVGAACVAFATAEAQEALGYGNWMKDLGMSDGWYTGLMVTANVAAIAINLVGVKQCFKEGTLVQTEDGLKPIEEVQVGDKVLAYDEETGGQAYKKVVQLFRNQTNEWYHIHVNGEEIICTGGHPFYVAELDKFIPARELAIGTKLLLSAGVCAIIKAIQVEQLSTPETTYNFEVEDFHTYYISILNLLVHNACKYFEANEVGDDYVIGKEITKKQAQTRLRNGKSVWVDSRSGAKSLAKSAFGNSKVYSDFHPNVLNPMKHFHDRNHHIYHVFF